MRLTSSQRLQLQKENFIKNYLNGDKEKGSILFWNLGRAARKYDRQCIVDNDDYYSDKQELQNKISDKLEKEIKKYLKRVYEILKPIGLDVNMESSCTSIVRKGENNCIAESIIWV